MKFTCDRCHGVRLASLGIEIGEWKFLIHLLPNRHWQRWGFETVWFSSDEDDLNDVGDGPYYEIGMGSLVLFCWG